MKKNHLFAIRIIIFVIFISVFLFFLLNRDASKETTGEQKIQVMVSILPQVEFVEEIGGQEVDVHAMVREGFSPATYEATPEQMKQLEDTDIYFRIGYIPFEIMHMDKIAQANPDMKIVDTSKNVTLRTLESHSHEHEETAEHMHEQEDEHEKESIDPHIWLSPVRVQQQVEVVADALIEILPEKKEYFVANKDVYIQKLKNLDTKLQSSFKPFQGKTMLVYHPAFGYLADDYGFIQEHIEIEGKEPSLSEVQDIISHAKEKDISVIFVQKQFSTQAAETIAQEINGSVVQINPLAQNYIQNMESIAQIITESNN